MRQRKKNKKTPFHLLVLISQLGITMLVAIAIGGWLGLQIGRWLHSDLIFPVFLLIGCLAGFRSCYIVIKKFISFQDEDRPVDSREKAEDRAYDQDK